MGDLPALPDRAVAVPPALVDREVSVRALLPPWQAVAARGVDPARLAEGTGYPVHHLTDPRQRISWRAYVRFMRNLGEILDDAALIALGGGALDSPMLRALLLPGRVLFTVPEFYVWAFGPDGPAAQVFVTVDGHIDELGPGHLRHTVRIKPGYEPSRENFLLLRGALAGLSRALGAGTAEVEQRALVDGAVYDIHVPAQGGRLGFVRRGLSWLLTARSTAEELRRAHAELHRRYVELQQEIDARRAVEDDLRREIDARRAVEEDLRRLNEELERRVNHRTAELAIAHRELGALSYSIAHDLRTPLRGIDGFSEAVLEDAGDQLSPESRDHLRRVRAAAQRMAVLIDDLLALSRVTRAQLGRAPVDLGAAARASIERLRQAAPDRDVEVTIGDDLTATGDPRLLAVAVDSLIDNAWKFTSGRHPARIDVFASHDDGATVFHVRDNGVGFDMAYAERIFGVFQQLHRVGEVDGTGVGLATVQRIVQRHGGRVWVDAEPDRGATFHFTLP